MTYSLDFRKKVLEVREKEGLSITSVANRFGIGRATVFRWTERIQPVLKRNKPATKLNMDELKQDIKKYPDAYLLERAKRLSVSKSCIFSALKRLNLTYKKNSKTSQSRRRKAQLV